MFDLISSLEYVVGLTCGLATTYRGEFCQIGYD
jgi:hypothetical protein